MKIAFSVCNIGFGHSTRSLNIMEELKERGHKMIVLVGEPYDDFFRRRGYETITLTKSINIEGKVGENIPKTLKFSSKMSSKVVSSAVTSRKVMRKFDPDLIVSDSELGSLFSTRSVKKVMLTHQPELFVEGKISKLNKIWRKVFKFSDRIIVPDVVGLNIPDKLRHIMERVGPLFSKVKENREELREKFEMEGKIVLMMPSFANTKKGKIFEMVKSLDKGSSFIFLGQDKNKNIGNKVRLVKKELVENPCAYIKASDMVVLSGYTSLMESVYYQKPVLMIPTQIEQKKIAELGEENKILMKGEFERDVLKSFIERDELHEEMTENQKKYHSNGAEEAADIIESL